VCEKKRGPFQRRKFGMAETKSSSAAVWVTTFFLAAVFLFIGATQLSENDRCVQAWEPMRKHFADWFFNSVAVLEMSAAVLLLFSKTAWMGAATLALIMVGAVVTIFLYEPPLQAILPALFFVSLSSLAYYRFPRKQPPT
jgi:uncharacterized membrane protein YphA (DoxX/SURF4 family)